MKKLLLSILISISSFLVSSQHLVLDDFYGNQIGDFVHLNWVIKKGSLCDGTNIYRSIDTITFEKIGSIPGICGDPDTETYFEFVDSFPINNQKVYYRLQLGAFGFSDFIKLEFRNYNGKAYEILGNPVFDGSKLIFENNKRNVAFINFFDVKGNMLNQVSTKNNFVVINPRELSQGVNLVRINVGNTQISSIKIFIP